MITAQQITKQHGHLTILKGVDINVPEASFYTIIGASGAGKTTLLQILGTLDKPTSGSVMIDGQNIGKLSQQALAKFRNRVIGFVFQFHYLLPEFTALENVCLPAWIAGQSKAAARTHAESLLKTMGLGSLLHAYPKTLSGGECQRVAVARAIINQPKVILADEPSGNLDSLNKQALYNLFFELRNQYGLTFLTVTHDDALANMSDGVYKMHDGLAQLQPKS